jgi:hypothetical protein
VAQARTRRARRRPLLASLTHQPLTEPFARLASNWPDRAPSQGSVESPVASPQESGRPAESDSSATHPEIPVDFLMRPHRRAGSARARRLTSRPAVARLVAGGTPPAPAAYPVPRVAREPRWTTPEAVSVEPGDFESLVGGLTGGVGEVVDSPGDDLRGLWRGESGSGEVLPGVRCSVGVIYSGGGGGAQGRTASPIDFSTVPPYRSSSRRSKSPPTDS